ncbi:hypothetical protein bcgnr5385_27960 [Bacillus cereus]
MVDSYAKTNSKTILPEERSDEDRNNASYSILFNGYNVMKNLEW